jgi:lipopolysaccharide biosynthesis glycosyltransferase
MRDVVRNFDRESTLTFAQTPTDFEAVKDIVDARLGTASMSRLMLPRILPHLDEVLYMDGDVIFNVALDELWATPLGNNLIAATFDPKERPNPRRRKLYRNAPEILDLRREGKNFCSGIAKFNLKAIRNEGLMSEFIRMSSIELPFADQDILNLVCRGRVVGLDSKYGLLSAKEGAAILHYFGPQKPWSFAARPSRPDDEMLWWHYALMTPFAEWFVAEYRRKAMTYAARWRLPHSLCNFICAFIPGKQARVRFRQSHSIRSAEK